MAGSDPLNTLEARSAMREGLQAVTSLLIAELAGRLAAGTVIRCVARAREQLLGFGVSSELAVAADSMARLRLSERLPAHRIVG